jgi:hypothetical protein
VSRSRGADIGGIPHSSTEVNPERWSAFRREARVGQKLSSLSSEAHSDRWRCSVEASGLCSTKVTPR